MKHARQGLAYYSVSNAAHYPGLVALIDSLALAADPAPIFVTDCGLTDRQRASLEAHVTLITPETGLHPTLQKAVGPLASPFEVMAVIDADIIVTESLRALVDLAAAGHLVAFVDYKEPERFFPEWAELGLGTPRRLPYVNAGHLILPVATAASLYPLLMRLHDRIVIDETMFGEFGTPASPYFYADQDVLNAILCTAFDRPITRVPRRLAPMPPFDGLAVSDLKNLVCEFEDGTRPYQLHHAWRKPWLVPMDPSPYSALFTRLVTGADVPVPLGADEIPLRLRGGLSAHQLALVSIERRVRTLLNGVHGRIRGRLGLRPKLVRLMRRPASARSGTPLQATQDRLRAPASELAADEPPRCREHKDARMTSNKPR